MIRLVIGTVDFQYFQSGIKANDEAGFYNNLVSGSNAAMGGGMNASGNFVFWFLGAYYRLT